MQNYRLGEYIRQRRLDLGLTQEQVCAGICESITLSRFENGKQTPSRTRINAILQRLGLPDDRYYALVTPEELEIESLKKEIVACNAFERVQDGFEKIEQLEKIAKPDDHITQQFILRSKVLLGQSIERYTKEEQLKMLMRAIQLTSPDFDPDKINERLYTTDELKIINQIGNVYSNLGDNKKAAGIFYQLLKYMKKHFEEATVSSGMLPMTLYNCARVMTLIGDYQDGAQMAEEGRKTCLKYGHYQYLPGCIAISAECSHFLSDDEKSLRYYRQAYYLFDALQDERNKNIIRGEVDQYFGLNVEA